MICDFWGWFRSTLYDGLILPMTIGWYEIVLQDLDHGSRLLDVGVGTAGALVACQHLIRRKQLQVVGMDYDDHYLRQAQGAIGRANLTDQIQLVTMNVYHLKEEEKKAEALSMLSRSSSSAPPPTTTTPPSDQQQQRQHETTKADVAYFDAVYFSGSFSLLPDWSTALTSVASVLRPNGKIYITQTYQKQHEQALWWWLSWIKPLLRHVTTIDFGQLVTLDQIEEFYDKIVLAEEHQDWKLLRHEKVPHNVDNPWQAAYWTCFQIAGV
jgi:ubiquinone/menaquinone biosynthesis C-methylase UbiE